MLKFAQPRKELSSWGSDVRTTQA